MDSLVSYAILLLLSAITFASLFAAVLGLFPARVGHIRTTLQLTPIRAAVVGAINLTFFGLLTLGSFALGEATGIQLLALPGVLIIAVLLAVIALGLTGTAALLGERLLPSQSALRQVALGGMALSTACYAPLVGWFVLFPCLMAIALGAFILSFFVRPAPPPPDDPALDM